ncbi:MAG: hypothetical protein ACLPVY_27275, partial [Acidimicrobiia bacterium]
MSSTFASSQIQPVTAPVTDDVAPTGRRSGRTLVSSATEEPYHQLAKQRGAILWWRGIRERPDDSGRLVLRRAVLMMVYEQPLVTLWSRRSRGRRFIGEVVSLPRRSCCRAMGRDVA